MGFFCRKSRDRGEKQQGFAVLFAVLVSSLVLSVGVSIFSLTLKEFTLSSQVRDSQLAFYAADAGSECALFWDLAHPNRATSIFGSFGDTLSDGLVGYWRLDDGVGSTTAQDASGNGHDGTLVNLTADSDVWVAGEIDQGIRIVDVGSYVSIPDESAFDLTEYTYAFWIKVQPQAEGSGWRKVIGKGTDDFSRRNPGIWLRPDSMSLHMGQSDTEGAQVAIGATSNLLLDTWTHVAMTSSGSSGALEAFIDGASDKTVNHSQSLEVNNDSVRLGNSSGATDIVLDDVRIYDRVLTDDEIKAIADKIPSGLFGSPADPLSDRHCNGEDITDKITGWDDESGWDETPVSGNGITTTFDMQLVGDACSTVSVTKEDGETTIISRGYNTCETSDPNRVERAIQITY